MPTAQKAKAIEQAKNWYDKSVAVVFTDYRGLKVKEMQDLRQKLAAKGGEIHVVKNTLFRLAAGDDVAKLSEEMHSGPTAIAFFIENEAECAKVLFDFGKTNKNLVVKGGMFGGKVFDSKQVEEISKLPPRDVLISQLIGTIAAPLSNLVGVIEALYADPIRTIGAVADKVAEGSPLPESAAASEPVAKDDEATSEMPLEETPKVDETPEQAEAAIEEAVQAETNEGGDPNS